MSSFDSAVGAVLKFTIVAFVCSLAIAVSLVIWSFAEYPNDGTVSVPSVGLGLLIGAGVSLPFVVVSGLVIGLPAHLLLKKNGFTSLRSYFISGFALGGVAGGLILGSLWGIIELVPRGALLGIVAGAVASALWWKLQVATTRFVTNA